MPTANYWAIPSRPQTFNGSAPTTLERRRRPRACVHWPVILFRNSIEFDAVETTTLNFSTAGFYCLSPKLFTVGELLFCVLKIPLDGNGAEARLECRVSVIRTQENAGDGMFGIACRILEYHVGRNHGRHTS